MNKLSLISIFAVAVCARPPTKPSVYECFENLQSKLDKLDLTNLNDFAENIVATLEVLSDHYRRCQDIPRDDPPTVLQQLLIDGCESSWKVSVAAELGRIGLEIQLRVNKVVDVVGEFSECTGLKFPLF